MKLRQKLLAWTAPGIALVGVVALGFAEIVGRSVAEQEEKLRQVETENARRQLLALEGELETALSEYAFWDELSEAIASEDIEWLGQVGDRLHRYQRVDLVLLFDREGELLNAYDPSRALTPADRGPGSALRKLGLERPGETAIWVRAAGAPYVWVVAGTVHPTTEDVYRPPGDGVLVAGRVLTEAYQGEMQERLGVAFRLAPPGAEADGVATLAVLEGVEGAPVVRVDVVPRQAPSETPLRAFWVLAIYYAVCLSVGLALLIVAVDGALVAPLLSLRRAVEDLRRGGYAGESLPIHRTDEVGELSREITALAGDLRRSEQRLSRSQEDYRTIVETAEEGIWRIDALGRITFVNHKMAMMLGYEHGELQSRPLASLLHPGSDASSRTELERTFREQGGRCDLKFQKKNGEALWAIVSATPIQDRDGSYAGALGMVTDITDHKRVEHELVRAIDAATEASRVKGDFLATVSHEIRTPMNGVIGMAGLLLDSELTSEQREFAQTIRSSGAALLTVINDVLDFSKIEANKLELESIPFDLRSTVEDAVDLIAEKAHEKGLELSLWVPSELPTSLVGDPGRIRQILLNLLGNAVKFTYTGEVELTARLERDLGESVLLRFIVDDSGIGVPESARNMIFESFTQADSSTTRRYGGTGLGLSISKRLANLMGGSIGVENRAGGGSRFWFTVRVEKRPADSTRPPPLRGAGARILVVDDREINRRMLSDLVGAAGFEVVAAASGDEAIAALVTARERGRGFRLVLLDETLSGEGGAALAERIRSIGGLEALSLVLLRAAGKRQSPASLLSTFVDVLYKPIRLSRLQRVLVDSIGTHTGREGEIEPRTDELDRCIARVLLVEDSIVNQKVVARMLEKLGCWVDVAANGSEAVVAFEHFPYDAVLMDIHMPEMDGLQATEAIRRLEKASLRGRTPIIAMTASVTERDREECLAAGMDDYMPKPVVRSVLSETLQRWIYHEKRTLASAGR